MSNNYYGNDIPNKWLVQKFGGTSVSTASRWHTIAGIVHARRGDGYRLMVVCSALSGITNALDSLADSVLAGVPPDARISAIIARHEALCEALGLDASTVLERFFQSLRECVVEFASDPGPRTRAELLAMGERMSSALGCAFLCARGMTARWLDARYLLFAEHSDAVLDDERHFLSARCTYEPNPRLLASLHHGDGCDIVITQGFVARDSRGYTVLLGRGGSDSSASYLAAILSAERLEVWTDVPGLFSANPQQIPGARMLPRVSYEEARVYAGLGAKVLHPRCLLPVQTYGIPVRVGWTERPELAGTWIDQDGSRWSGVRTVSARRNLLLISMTRDAAWQPVGFMAQVASCFSRHGLSMDLIATSPGDIRVSIDRAACPHLDDALPVLLAELSAFCRPEVVPEVTCVSIAGRAIRADAKRLSEVLATLAGLHVYMVCWAADDSHLSVVIAAEMDSDLVEHIHRELFEQIDHGSKTEHLGPSWQSINAPADPMLTAVSTAPVVRLSTEESMDHETVFAPENVLQ